VTVRIVTDSSCDLPEDVAVGHGIRIVPLTIRFGAEEFLDREELSTAEFWRRCASSSTLPETAAPAPGQFEQVYRELLAEGATGIVVVSLSSALSATMQSAELAAREVAGVIPVRVVDSRSVSLGVGTIAIACASRAAEGGTLDEVADLASDLASRTHVWGALDTLENLKKGGRIGGAQHLLGNLLSIKPLIDVSTGRVEEAGKARTRKKALQWLANRLLEEPAVERLSVAHGGATDLDEFLDLIASRYPRDQIRVGVIGAVIGTHAGPRVMGVTWQRPPGAT
jgi:DegV family protein with EDD domain